MKKLSNINESIWGDLARRSGGTQVRNEDDPDGFIKLFGDIKKIPDSELFNPGDNFHTLWTPYNFGATKPDEPGLYLNAEEIMNLNEIIKNTEYRLATQADWQMLSYLAFEYKRINGIWTYIFYKKDQVLYVPNFGYISIFYAEHPEQKERISGKLKENPTPYGTVLIHNYPGWCNLDNVKHYFGAKVHRGYDGPVSDRVQVRLVKEI